MKQARPEPLAIAVTRALGVGAATLAVAATTPAFAQQAQKIEKIEVTGSNIKRVEGEGPSAIVVLTKEDIDRSGATNAYELLNLVSANNSNGNISIANTIGSLTFSANTASLRGLQGGRTLVLLNGRRLELPSRARSRACRVSTSRPSRSTRSSAWKCCWTAPPRSTARTRSRA